MFEIGQEVYYIYEDTVELTTVLANYGPVCVLDLNGEMIRVKIEHLTASAYEVCKHIDKQIAKHESKIAVLKAKHHVTKLLETE
jgi:hypothetical protein